MTVRLQVSAYSQLSDYTVQLQPTTQWLMKNKAVNAPIKFEEIAKVMINRLIDWFYPCRSSWPLSFYRRNSKDRTQNSSKTLKKHFSGKRTKIYINFNFFCFVLEQRTSEDRDFRFGSREKWNESENMKEGEGEGNGTITSRSDVGDGSKTVAEKVNSRSFNLHRDYFKSLTLSNVGEPWKKDEFLWTISSFRKREEISSSLTYFPCKTWN